jgi:hypothetical protein
MWSLPCDRRRRLGPAFPVYNHGVGSGAQAGTRSQNAEADAREGQRKIDEFAEAAKWARHQSGWPAVVWTDVAGRHLDLMTGSVPGRTSGDVPLLVRQATSIRRGNTAGRVHTRWVNPNLEGKPAAIWSPTRTTNVSTFRQRD